MFRKRKQMHQNLALDVWLLITELESALLSSRRGDDAGYERSVKRIEEIKHRVLEEHVA